MEGKVKCSGCGHSWNKSDSSKKDVYICHQCGKDNVMKDGGWLNKYDDGGFVQPNANDSKVSMSEDFVGLGYNTKGRNYSPAWGGQFQDGGLLKASPQQQIISSIQPQNDIQPTVPYTKTKNPVEFYKSWIQSPEYERRQLLTGYTGSPKNKYETDPIASEVRNIRLASLDKIDPIQYDYRQKSEARPGYHGAASYVNINPFDYSGTSKESIEAHELAHIAGATELGKLAGMSSQEHDMFKQSELPTERPKPSGVQGSEENKASYRDIEDYEHMRKPKEAKADLDALRFMMYDRGIYDITEGNEFTETDFEKAKQILGKDRVFKRLTDRIGKKNFVNLMNTIASADEEIIPIAQNGASMPGSVGFTYARTIDSAPSNGPYAKKTKASAQGGKDINRVSTSDPRYAELYKNRQVGSFYDGAYNLPDLPEFVVEGKDERVKEAMARTSQGFLQGVLNTLSAPQEVTMDLLTGKQQAPSEAFGFQQTGGWLDSPTSFGKNLSNFAMDAVLDPMNLVGVGIADDIARTTLKGLSKKGSPKQLASSVDDVGKNLPKLEQIPLDFKIEDVLKNISSTERKNMEIIKKGNAYFKELDNPESLKRLKEFGDEYGIDLLDAYKKAERRWDYGNNIGKNDRFQVAGDEIFKDDIVDAMGVSTIKKEDLMKNFLSKDKTVKKDLSESSINYINEKSDLLDYDTIVWHELSHDINKNIIGSSKKLQDDISNIFVKNTEEVNKEAALKAKEISNNLYKSKFERSNTGKFRDNKAIDETITDELNYVSKPTETWAFLSTNLRQDLKNTGVIKDYNELLTPEKLEQAIKNGNTVFSRFEPYIKNKDGFIKLFNKMTLALVPAAITTGALAGSQVIDQQRNGGNTSYAQNGQEMRFYQNGLDWKPKSMQDGGVQKTSEEIKKEQEEIKKARETAFRTIQPSSYDDLKNMGRWMFNIQRETYDDPRSEEFWRNYLKQPGELQYLKPSQYKPTISKNKDVNYYSVDNELEKAIFDSFKDKLEIKEIKKANESDISGKYNTDTLQNFVISNPGLGDRNPSGSIARALGNFTVSKGMDDRGEYISYYDTYDFPEWIQNKVKGEPYEIYGRIYYPNEENNKRNGGIIKDNDGYLNPNNFGKVVEIDSNNITMEGVYEPLLGISDTGDTKLMQPGKNYKFKGKKVTEFPVAKNGAWLDSYRSGGRVGINDLDAQPMKKLNQLTNFTNNPDKDNWLNKYN